MKKIFLFLTLTIINQNLCAGDREQEKGDGYLKLSLNFINAEDFFNTDGEEIPLNGTFTDISINIYGEYSLSDILILTADFNSFRYTQLETAPGPEYDLNSVTGIGDALIGVRASILKSSTTTLSTGLNFNLPFGKSSPDGGLLTGSGDYYQGLLLMAEHILYPAPAYLSASVTFNNRTEGYSDEFKYKFEGGYFLYTDLTIALQLKGVHPLYNGKNDKSGGLGIFLNEQNFFSAGGELIYQFTKNFGLTLLYSNPLFGKNIVSSPVYAIGIFYSN